jgi:hypothetical protein
MGDLSLRLKATTDRPAKAKSSSLSGRLSDTFAKQWLFLAPHACLELRVRAKINSQILSVEAPAGQGAKAQAYQAYSELSQHRQAGCIGA